ncbi:MAG: ribose-phosphate pyrophosphokinase [Patescibacteria group bacterium]
MIDTTLPSQYREKLFLASGETHSGLSMRIADAMGLKLGGVILRTHPNTEQYVRYEESVRGKHVMAIQPHARTKDRSVSDALHQHLEMIYAAKLASAAQITAVAPNLAGARQDRQSKGRESVSIALTLLMLKLAGASRVVTVDLHSPQTLPVFDGPCDHLTAQPLLRESVRTRIVGDPAGYVVVSPDIGHSKMAEHHAQALGVEVIHMTKTRDPHDSTKIIRQSKVHGVNGRTCFIIDDILDTAGTLQSAAESLHNSGASRIVTAATHGWFSDPAIERLKNSPIDEIFITDTMPVDTAQEELGSQLQVVSVSGMIAHALREIVVEGSVSEIFQDQNHM